MVKFLGLLGDNDRMVLSKIRGVGDAWIVGGWVRDAISGSPVGDLDIATTLKPDEVKDLFPRSLMVGEKYGTVSVRLDEPSHEEEVIWEVTTLRGDGGYGDGRRPDNVEFGQ
ncbi:MAG: CCA tRNA nucleotidyltransferase, partial [Candidatus Thermoplasmatota archaeon]|nr:CCA tRNA nucleotidyltransferase [Candidatus Thermoplasmatota archaeon]